MPRPRAGSWPWLLAHELRLLWRSFGIRSRIMVALAVLFVAVAHVAGWAMLRSHALDTLVERSPASAILITLFVTLLVVSSAFGLAVRVLFERGDVELLMSSPVPMATVYLVRGIAVALGSVGSMALFTLPFANMGPFVGRWQALGAWPAVASLGLLSAALSLGGTLALVNALGLRRARLAAQFLGAFIGVIVLLVMQAEALLPRPWRQGWRAWFEAQSHGGWLGSDSPLLWPMRAFMGEAMPLAGIVLVAVVAFVGVIRYTQHAFLRALQDAPQATAPGRKRGAGPPRERPFATGLARVVMRKELLLVARDPTLIAKALLQVLYLVPLFIVTVQRAQPAPLLASGLVVLAASLAGTLAWITVSGEEAPELLGSAPVSIERLRWLKVAAALAPVAVLVAPFLAWFAAGSVITAAAAALFIALALASSAVVQVWATPLGAGRDVRQRYRQNPFVNIADTVSSFGWALACYLALARSPWVAAGVALGLLAPAAAWISGSRDR